MRWFYLAFVILFAAVTLIFAFQNLEQVTMSFLGFNLRAPLAALVVIVYALGAFTGGGLFGLLRSPIRGPRAFRARGGARYS